MEELFRYLTTLAPLPAELQAALVTRTTRESYRAKKTILTTGQICDWIGLVESGLVKVCYDVPGGDERIVQFAKAGETVFSPGSFTTGMPSKMSVVVIEEAVVRKIRKVELEELVAKYPSFHVHLRKIIELHTQMLEDHYLLYILPARERYRQLIESNSWLLKDNRIKDYMIADFLGIGRGSFSRFRNGNG